MDLSKIEDKDLPDWMSTPTVGAGIARAAIAVVQDALENVDVHPCDVHDEAVRAARLVEPVKSLYDALKVAGVRFRF
jgi:hypothetical protein